MSAIWLPTSPASDTKAMRHFAYSISLVLIVLFGLTLPLIFHSAVPHWPFVVGLFLSLCGWLSPRWVYYPYRLWMLIASILNFVNTRIIMFVTFFGLITPTALVRRAFGKHGYPRYPDKNAATYWMDRENPPNAANLKEPF